MQLCDMERNRIWYLTQVTLLFIIYYFTAKVGLQLNTVSGFATLFWLPTGISLAAILIGGYRVFPGILLGAFLINYQLGASPLVAAGIAFGNTAEALCGAYLLKRFVDFHPTLDRLKDVVGLIIFAAGISTIISATVGVSSLLLGGKLTTAYSTAWVAWWIGDAISNLITAPFLLVWTRIPKLRYTLHQLGEAILFTIFTVVSNLFVFKDCLTVHQECLLSPILFSRHSSGQRFGLDNALLQRAYSLFLYLLFFQQPMDMGHLPQAILLRVFCIFKVL